MTEKKWETAMDLTPPPNIRNAKCCKFCKHYGVNGGNDFASACAKYSDGPFLVYPTSLCDDYQDVEFNK